MKKIRILIIAALAFQGLVTQAQTARINFKAPMVYPEGIAFDQGTGLYYVSSVTTGQIGTVDQQGNYKTLYSNKDLISSFGMKVEPGKGRLWVCLSDPDTSYSKNSSPATFQKMARLIAIDLRSGKKTLDIDLAGLYQGKHFANDLCWDGQGNAYITDSFSPVIYKVDPQGKASVFAESELFRSEDIGLNGIVFHPSGYLLVGNNGDGSILKVPLNHPKNISKVEIKQLFPGADGLLIDGDKNLVLIQNKGVDKIFKISSSDDWKTAKVIAATGGTDRFAKPSTGVINAGKVWIVNSKLNELTDATKPPSKEFSLQMAEFKPIL